MSYRRWIPWALTYGIINIHCQALQWTHILLLTTASVPPNTTPSSTQLTAPPNPTQHCTFIGSWGWSQSCSLGKSSKITKSNTNPPHLTAPCVPQRHISTALNTSMAVIPLLPGQQRQCCTTPDDDALGWVQGQSSTEAQPKFCRTPFQSPSAYSSDTFSAKRGTFATALKRILLSLKVSSFLNFCNIPHCVIPKLDDHLSSWSCLFKPVSFIWFSLAPVKQTRTTLQTAELSWIQDDRNKEACKGCWGNEGAHPHCEGADSSSPSRRSDLLQELLHRSEQKFPTN